MLFTAAILLIVSIVGLIAGLVIGTPPPGYPRHGTFGVNGFNSGSIATACIAMCVVGLILLYIDSKRPKPTPGEPGERDHTGADELFGEHDVERDLHRGA
jgi:hypothetical protein